MRFDELSPRSMMQFLQNTQRHWGHLPRRRKALKRIAKFLDVLFFIVGLLCIFTYLYPPIMNFAIVKRHTPALIVFLLIAAAMIRYTSRLGRDDTA